MEVTVNENTIHTLEYNPERNRMERMKEAAPDLYDAVCGLLDYAHEALYWAGGEKEIRGKAPRILREIQECQQLLDRIDGKENNND